MERKGRSNGQGNVNKRKNKRRKINDEMGRYNRNYSLTKREIMVEMKRMCRSKEQNYEMG